MKTPSFKCLLSLFTLALSIAAWADRTWIGNSGGNWSDSANWDDNSGRYLINSSATINFSGLTKIPTGLGDAPVLRIFGGSKDSPVIFTTGDSDDRERGLILSDGAGNSAIGSGIGNTSADGYLTIRGGYYKIGANDLVIGGHYGKNGVVTLDYGKIETYYWLVMGGYADGSTSEFNINGGEVQVGSGNGRLVIGQYAGTKATVTQTGGTVTSQQADAALEMACNGTTATYNISGGKYIGTGRAWLGAGKGSKADLNISGTAEVTITDGTLVGADEGAEGVITVSGGKFNPNWMVLGGKKGVSRATGILRVNGGRVDMKETLYVTEADGGANSNTGLLEVVSGTVYLHTSYFGRSNNSLGELMISGGEVNADKSMTIGVAAGAEGNVTVSGGSLTVAAAWADVVLGDNGNGTLTIKDKGTVSCGSESVGTWLKLGNAGDGKRVVNLEEGGTLKLWHVERFTSSGTSEFNFNGGTLVALGTDNGNSKYLLGNTDPAHTENPTVNINSKGGAVNTNGKGITITADMSGVGTLTKEGSGTLTLSGGYFAGIAVAEGAGSVTTPGGNTVNEGESFFLVSKINRTATTDVLDGKALWIEANGKVTLTGVELDFDTADEQTLFDVSAFKLLNETVATETDVSAYFTIDGATEAYKIIYKSGAVYAVANRTPNNWIGEGEGAWTEPSNWSEKVVPDEHSLVVFDRNAVVTCSGMGSAKRWLRLKLENNATVEFKNTDDTSYPGWTIDSNSIEGNGTIILTHCGFYASTDVEIPSTINIVIQNSTLTTDNGYNCWLSAADGHSLTVGGAVEVKNFLSTDGTVTFNNAVTVYAGARLNISSGTTTFNAALTCDGSAVLEKGSSAAVVAGQSASFTAPTGDSHIDAAIAALFGVDTTVNVWRGGETGDWGEKTNWRYGVPTSLNNAVFTSKASVSMSGAQEMNALEVQNNSEVSLIRSSGDPSLRFKAMTGTGTLKLTHIGLVKIGDAESADIASTLTLDIQALNGNADFTDCWFSVDGTGVLNVYARITGLGFVHFYDGTRLYGDNSQFKGRVLKDNVDARFMTPESGFPNALRIDIHGNLYAWFESGELALGGNLTMTTYQENYTSLKWLEHEILTKNNSESVTIVVGGGNGTVRLQGNNRKCDTWNWAENGVPYNCAHGTIRKIGTGKMRCRMHGSYNLDIREGEVNMTDVFADRPLASIAVARGATVTGFAVCQTATLNSGAIVKQTVTGSGTSESSYTCPTLMVNGDVNVAGVKFAVDGVDLSQVTSGENANLTLLSATGTVTGTPVAEGSIASQNKIWKPTVRDNSVVMSLMKGFALFIY